MIILQKYIYDILNNLQSQFQKSFVRRVSDEVPHHIQLLDSGAGSDQRRKNPDACAWKTRVRIGQIANAPWVRSSEQSDQNSEKLVPEGVGTDLAE